MNLNLNDIYDMLDLDKANLPYPTDKDIRFINGFCVYFNRHEWIINGQFPLEFIKTLDDVIEHLGITYNGQSNNPVDFTKIATHKRINEELKKFSKSKMSIKDFVNNCERIMKDCLENDYENCYVETLYIEKTNGLKYIVDAIRENNIKSTWFE